MIVVNHWNNWKSELLFAVWNTCRQKETKQGFIKSLQSF